MFLPALLMRDMGWPGFLIFAFPNVIGAAAMGWTIKSGNGSVRFVEKHAEAIWWFSAVTLAFHAFWLLWLLQFVLALFELSGISFAVVVAGAVFLFMAAGRDLRAGRISGLSFGVLALSLCVLAASFFVAEAGEPRLSPSLLGRTAPLWMLPVMIHGFLLCPYLDITFHHARQKLDSRNGGRLGFTIGFVAFFSFMIILTTRYAGAVIGVLEGTAAGPIAPQWIAVGILAHILFQWVFTVRVHLNRIQTLPAGGSRQKYLVGIMLFAALLGLLGPRLPAYAGLGGGELVYRGFMSAYGLVFPTYVLYRCVMARGNRRPVSLGVMWASIALASPLFWFGFMGREPVWLIPGMAVLIIGAFSFFFKRKADS
jgi:hypothetical protein